MSAMSADDRLVYPGDRVRLRTGLARYHGCEYGVIRAIFKGSEDTVELLLDNGAYTCVDPPDFTKAEGE